jgi:hypothetical protein
MELLENKKPRFKNRGFFCGPIKTNGLTKSTYLSIGDTPILIFSLQLWECILRHALSLWRNTMQIYSAKTSNNMTFVMF